MIKLMALLFKKPGLTDEEFTNYWKGKHGALAGKIIPELRKYTQNHFLKLPGLKYEGDGFAELWFDDLEALKKYLAWRQTAAAQPQFQAAQSEYRICRISVLCQYSVETVGCEPG